MATDIPELGGMVAQVQTYIVTAACVLGVMVCQEKNLDLPFMTPEHWIMMFSTLGVASALNKVPWKMGMRQRNAGQFI
jgi:hypothetical protein